MKIYKDGLYLEVEETEPEIVEINEPTVEERICSLESAVTDLAMMIAGVEHND